MADEFNNGFGGGADGFDGGEGTAGSQADRPRGDRINKKRLEGLSDNGKTLQIFYRPNKDGPLVQCKEITNVSRDVAGICSDLIDKKVIMRNDNIFFLPEPKKGEDPIPIAAWKFVFEWINKCGEEKTDVSIKDGFPLPEPPENEDGLGAVIDILRAAQKLRIPYDSFQKFVIKQMMPLSRKYLIELDRVEKIYFDANSEYAAFPELQEVAWTSIFDHWYMYKLEGEEWDEYMGKLDDLRNKIGQLDHDLKEAITKKDEALKAARERKRAKDAGEENNTTTGDDGNGGGWRHTGDENSGGDGGGSADWAVQTGSDDYGGGNDDWATKAADNPTTNEWDTGAHHDTDNSGGNWAEEMNNDHQHNSSFEPAIAAPNDGW